MIYESSTRSGNPSALIKIRKQSSIGQLRFSMQNTIYQGIRRPRLSGMLGLDDSIMVYTRAKHIIRWLPRFRLENMVHAELHKAYEAMCNFKRYPELIPQHFPSIRIRSVRGNVAVVEEHMNLGGRQLVIMAKHVSRPPSIHDMFVIGGDIKGTSMRQKFSVVGEGDNNNNNDDDDDDDDDYTQVVTDVNLKLGLAGGIKSVLDPSRYERDYGAILRDLAAAAESA